MSDQINQLIHTNARMAFEQGVKTEQQRSLEIAESFATALCKCDSCHTARAIAAAIKEGQK